MVRKFIGRYVNSLWVVIGLEVVGVTLILFGILPREAALFLLGIFTFFVIFAPFKQAVLFAVFSIPLYTALPITDTFDSMAAWRIVIAILFLRTLMRGTGEIFFRSFSPAQRLALRLGLFRSATGGDHAEIALKSAKEHFPSTSISYLSILVSLFFGLGLISLFVAQEPIFGIRKLLYLVNIFALFFVVIEVIKSRQDFVDVLKFTFAGSVLALVVGYGQFVAILFVPLYTFWQWWAFNVIPVFYGANLGNLLSHSNTWFSYYEEAEATLRVFSIFPDSHSFALSMVLALPMALTFFIVGKGRAQLIPGAFVVLALLSIIFSGTRGVWVGAIPVLLALIIIYILQKGFWKKYFRLLGLPVCPRDSEGIDGLTNSSPLGLAVGSLINLSNKGGSQKYFFQKSVSIVKISIAVFFLFMLLFPVSAQLLKFSQMRQGGIVSESSFERISTSFSTREFSNLGRIQIWKSTLESIAEKPILGVGMGNYPIVLNENISATKEGASAHSLYLDVISEMGILGGVILLLIFITILIKAVKIFIGNSDPVLSSFAGFFAVYFLWVMAYSAVDIVLLNDKVLLLCTVLVALLYARINQHSRV